MQIKFHFCKTNLSYSKVQTNEDVHFLHLVQCQIPKCRISVFHQVPPVICQIPINKSKGTAQLSTQLSALSKLVSRHKHLVEQHKTYLQLSDPLDYQHLLLKSHVVWIIEIQLHVRVRNVKSATSFLPHNHTK